jgi:hypothetical protein
MLARAPQEGSTERAGRTAVSAPIAPASPGAGMSTVEPGSDGFGRVVINDVPGMKAHSVKEAHSVDEVGNKSSIQRRAVGGRNVETQATAARLVRKEGEAIKPGDHVGIGTTNPTKALDVQGDINVSGNINATYQDVAEWVPSIQKLRAGTVVVLDTARTNHVVASNKSYDTGVAGVVSDTPGVILGQAGDDKLKVATTGRVKVKVDATHAPIKVGDLLVTSDVEGVAMKSIPVDLGGTQIHRPGTIIGKALEPLEKGTGEILVLLSLQ